MKKISYFLLAISFILLCISLISFVIVSRPLKVEEFYTSVYISSGSAGFDLNGSALTFGKVNLGGSATRNIILSNEYTIPVIARVSVRGNIGEIINHEEFVFVGPYETKKIEFVIYPPNNFPEGFYDGNVKIRVFPA